MKKMEKVGKNQVGPADKFWVTLTHPEAIDMATGLYSPQVCKFSNFKGKILMSVEVLPINIANEIQNGYGRDPPNVFPIMPEPEGRMAFVRTFFNKLGHFVTMVTIQKSCWAQTSKKDMLLCVLRYVLGTLCILGILLWWQHHRQPYVQMIMNLISTH
jgi:hypothetical protein